MGETIILSVLPKAIAGLNKNSLRQKPGLRLIFPLFNVFLILLVRDQLLLQLVMKKMNVCSCNGPCHLDDPTIRLV